MKIGKIQKTLQHKKNKRITNQRNIALLAIMGLLNFSFISLYQIGIIKNMPDPPGQVFDSNKANGSRHAYQAGLPDGPLAIIAYAFTIVLAIFKGNSQSGRPKWVDRLLLFLSLMNAGSAAAYMKNMIQKQERACLYCIFGALINSIILFFSIKQIADEDA